MSVYRGATFGCHNCSLSNIPGIRSVKGLNRIQKRKAMLWTQSPGKQENLKGLELIGPAGQFLWKTAKKFNLSRNIFDVQNVLRCRPADESGEEHHPTKQELLCCSAYNDDALDRNAGNAVVHLVLGEVAGLQLLGKEYKKARPVFWHEPWNAYVVLGPHPSYIIRSGGETATWQYGEFCDRLRATRCILDHPGKWGYLKAQNYGAVTTRKQMDELRDRIYREAKAGRRVSVDIETDDPLMLMVGFGWGQYRNPDDFSSWIGGARSVVLNHPENANNPDLPYLLKSVKGIIEDPAVEKVLQHGSSDKEDLMKFAGMHLRGYTYDVQYAAYLKNSNLRTYSLGAIGARMFPEFGPWKTMLDKWSGHYANAPLSELVPYNCADCDVTKRSETRDAPYVSAALVKVYIHDAIVLDKMEQRGPLLDREAWKRVYEVIPKMLEDTKRQLCQIAGKRDFNPNTPADIAWLLFDKLKLPEISGRSTNNETLNLLILETDSPVPKLVIRHRTLHTMKTTFLDGYARSADINNGELRTIWWLTGAATGRLRSGKGDRGEAEGVINFQNCHGNPLLQNLLVSDLNWREALRES